MEPLDLGADLHLHLGVGSELPCSSGSVLRLIFRVSDFWGSGFSASGFGVEGLGLKVLGLTPLPFKVSNCPQRGLIQGRL